MSELRKEFDLFSSEALILRPVLFDCSVRDLELRVPQPGNDREEAFLLDYIVRNMFNALSVLGGQSMSIYYDKKCEWLSALVSAAVDTLKTHPSYSRVIRINSNMASALGFGRFYFSLYDLRAHELAETPDIEPYEYLPQKLIKSSEKACKGLYLGLDLGGSDIKLIRAEDGHITMLREYDWDPGSFEDAEMTVAPILELVNEAAEGRLFDAIGISYPDICCVDRIVGGETPKTKGLKDAHPGDYAREFAKISALADRLREFAADDAPVKIINDGHMSAFTAAAELAFAGCADLSKGVIAHSLGTDLGFGMIDSRGAIADMPQEFYDIFIDMGDFPSASICAEDLRSSLNDASGLPDARRYMGQSAAFRMAASMGLGVMKEFTEEKDGVMSIKTSPDMRKPCLEALMRKAEAGSAKEQEVFRQIGRNLGMVSREMQFLLHPNSDKRLVFGRFVKKPAVFELIKQGCAETAPFIELAAGDDGMAFTPLMKELSSLEGYTVAQFAQAVGAIYYALF